MNCKPGDLAYIVRARVTPELSGRIVEILRLHVDAAEFIVGNRYAINPIGWLVRSTTPLPTRDVKGQLSWVSQRVVADYILRPISGVPVHDEEHDEVTA